MKKIKLNLDKKLFLNKETISSLSKTEEQNVLGGAAYTDSCAGTCKPKATCAKTCAYQYSCPGGATYNQQSCGCPVTSQVG